MDTKKNTTTDVQPEIKEKKTESKSKKTVTTKAKEERTELEDLKQNRHNTIGFNLEIILEREKEILDKTKDVDADKELYENVKENYLDILEFKDKEWNNENSDAEKIELDAEVKINKGKELVALYEKSHTAETEKSMNFSEIQKKIKDEVISFFNRMSFFGKKSTEDPTVPEEKNKIRTSTKMKKVAVEIEKFWESTDKRLKRYGKGKFILPESITEKDFKEYKKVVMNVLIGFVSSSKCTSSEAINISYEYPFSTNKLYFYVLTRKDLTESEIIAILHLVLTKEIKNDTDAKYASMNIKMIASLENTPDDAIKAIMEADLSPLTERTVLETISGREKMETNTLEILIEKSIISSHGNMLILGDERRMLAKMISMNNYEGKKAISINSIRLLLGVMEIRIKRGYHYSRIEEIQELLGCLVSTNKMSRLLLAQTILMQKEINNAFEEYGSTDRKNKKAQLEKFILRLEAVDLKFAKDEALALKKLLPDFDKEQVEKKTKALRPRHTNPVV